jgi:hypothetical protein
MSGSELIRNLAQYREDAYIAFSPDFHPERAVGRGGFIGLGYVEYLEAG